MNDFFKDAGLFSRTICNNLEENLSPESVILNSLHWALCLEHLLKGILQKINPLYVLINMDFKNSAKAEYSTKIIPEAQNSKDLCEKPDCDVITLRNSILRAQHFSPVTYRYKSLLFFLSDARDIIVHHNLSLLDIEKLKNAIYEDFFPVTDLYVKECKLNQLEFFSGKDHKLRDMTARKTTKLDDKINLLIEGHKKKYASIKNTGGYIQEKIGITDQVVKLGNKIRFKCPACENDSLIYIKPVLEFNRFEGREIQNGFEIQKLKCHFCRLEIDDYKIIETLKLYDFIQGLT